MMRRSCLFIPANNPGMLQNASLFNSDAVIFDLEDAVSVSEKDSARILLKNYLDTFSLDTEVIIRINSLDTNFFMDDLNDIVTDIINTIMLPKANVNDINKLNLLLENIEISKKLKHKIKVIPIIELATSLLEVEKIIKLSRVDGLLLGAEDLCSDIEVERTKIGNEISFPRSKVAFACHAAKIDAIDTPFTDVYDTEGLKTDALVAQSLGMNAKAAIHPNQVAIINEVFSPRESQIDYALKVIELAKTNQGAFSLDNKMIDKPIIERCVKLIEKAKKYDLL